MKMTWREANRFLLIAGGVLLLSWLAHSLAIGGQVGGIDVVVAIAVATIVVGSLEAYGHRS